MTWPADDLRETHDVADEAAKPATVLVPAKSADAITGSTESFRGWRKRPA
jgi:hypothetical protein